MNKQLDVYVPVKEILTSRLVYIPRDKRYGIEIRKVKVKCEPRVVDLRGVLTKKQRCPIIISVINKDEQWKKGNAKSAEKPSKSTNSKKGRKFVKRARTN